MKRVFSTDHTKVGKGPLKYQWQKGFSSLISIVGSNNQLHIYDKHSDLVFTHQLTGACVGMEWSPDGDLLALIQEKSNILIIWDSNIKNISVQLDTGLKHLYFLSWSVKGDKLSIGTAKGNMLLYDRKSGKKIPIMGKHTKQIVCGAWNIEDTLACASDDHTFTISNGELDTIFQMAIKGKPSQIQWDDRGKFGSVLSMVLDGKTLFLHNSEDPENPIELAFQSKYGSIISYSWFGDGLVLIGFSTGFIVVISTKPDQIGQELFQYRDHKDNLTDISVSFSLNKVASCGDNSVKIHDLSDMQDVWAIINLEDERNRLDKIQWSEDGQFLSVSTKDGSLYTYLAKLPMLSKNFGTNLIFLSALKEVTVIEKSNNNEQPYKLDLDMEPTSLGMGPNHFAFGLEKSLWIYSTQKQASKLRGTRPSSAMPQKNDSGPTTNFVSKKDYPANIVSISMNGLYIAVVLADGKLIVNSLDGDAVGGKAIQKIFPDKEATKASKSSKTNSSEIIITSAFLSSDFLVYGTSKGIVHHYILKEWVLVNEIKHTSAIKSISCNSKGVKFIFIDDKNESYLCNPVGDTIFKVVCNSDLTSGALWNNQVDTSSIKFSPRTSFILWDSNLIQTFSYNPFTIKGVECTSIGSTRLPYGLVPVSLVNNIVTCLTPSGKLSQVTLISSDEPIKDSRKNLLIQLYVPKTSYEYDSKTEVEQGTILQTLYALGQSKDIWALVPIIKTVKPWTMLAESALHILDIQTAKRVYRQVLGNSGMVLTLEDLEWIDDRNLIAGHVAALMGNISLAQDLFLKSTNPIAILELRRDLMQWDQALNLAQTLAPDEVTCIAREYARQLELDGKFSESFAMYEKALSTSSQHSGPEELQIEHQISCSNGLARMTLRMGDIQRGLKMIQGCTERLLLSDCGTILDNLKQYPEAGSLYERGEKWEKAIECYIKAKNWARVGSLIHLVHNSRIIIQYGKNRESEKQYEEAAKAYERGRDYESLVRIYVDNLKNIDGAVATVRKTQCRSSAKLVSTFFESIKDHKSVVEFYIMAGMIDEAFEVAIQHDVMEHFAEVLKDEVTTEMLLSISNYFENKKQFLLAGKYLLQCGQYPKALNMFFHCPVGTSAAIDMAIETVGLANSDVLTHALIDFLMGERDGIAKEAKYIFKLHMSLKQYKEAARTAIIIAREEQVMGNYRAAHDLLLDNYLQLKIMKAKVPSELSKMLQILHSYILVKVLIRMEDHEKAAQMLIRVSNNISKFPAHIVQILTSTVIECQRAGLKRQSLEFAAMLMRPEYRNSVDVKYKRKIEQIVRRPDREETITEDRKTPCPFCKSPLTETSLDCVECKNTIPYCIATGRHMTTEEWSQCPHCEFPAILTDFKAVVDKTKSCPMCQRDLKIEDIVCVGENKVFTQQPEIEQLTAGKLVNADTKNPIAIAS